MDIRPLKLDGTYVIELSPIGDNRGYFARTYAKHIMEEHGLVTDWLQENQSLSAKKGTVRGLHFQYPEDTETKLVRVVKGALLDVFVDLRKGSGTYGKWDAVELSEDNFKVAYIPKGFAHGFCTLTDDVVIQYKVDALYAPDNQGGLRWNDPDIAIDWPVTGEPVLSERDANMPLFADFDSPF